MSRFNFNIIDINGRADISKVEENFEELETNGVAQGDIVDALDSTATNKVLSAKQGKALKDLIDAKQKTITSGTSAPSGGSNGDIYIQYF